MTLYLKYRPQNFDEMFGNENTLTTIQSFIASKDRPHTYMFHGLKGCGKTTLSRVIAYKLGAKGRDIHEIDTADYRGIEHIRELRRLCQYQSVESDCTVWILDECHSLTSDAQRALLKILEDTPGHVYFILCTTNPQKLLPTVRDRCTSFEMQPLKEKQMYKLLRNIVKAENDTIEKEIYEQIIQDSFCHPRAAIQILEQVLAVPEEQRLEVAKQVAETQSQSIELCRTLIQNADWKKVSNILNGLTDQDPESIRRHILGYCKSVLLKADNEQAGHIMEEFIEPFYNSGWPGLVLACYSVVKT